MENIIFKGANLKVLGDFIESADVSLDELDRESLTELLEVFWKHKRIKACERILSKLNKKILNELMDYHIQLEDYEMCALIKKQI